MFRDTVLTDQIAIITEALVAWPLLLLALSVGVLRAIVASPRFKGKAGEARVSRALQRGLQGEEAHLLDDVTLRIGTGTTQIDHIAITAAGIFVIETKNMSGWIFGDAGSRRWTQVLHRKKTPFQNPIHQNAKHVRAVQTATGLAHDRIFNLVVFTGRATPKTPFPDTVAWSARQLVATLRAQDASRLSPADMAAARDALHAARLTSGRDTDRAHVAHVRSLRRERN